MRDESEWRRLSNAFPTSLLRSVSEGVPECVYFCEHAKKGIEKLSERWRALFETCFCYAARHICRLLAPRSNSHHSFNLIEACVLRRCDVPCDQRWARGGRVICNFQIDSVLCFFSLKYLSTSMKAGHWIMCLGMNYIQQHFSRGAISLPCYQQDGTSSW